MDSDKAALRRTATREAALALLEDIEHVHQLVLAQVPPSRGELRRLSGVLRRLLVDEDLKMIAAPRIGTLLIRAPDNTPFAKANEQNHYQFFISGGATVLGMTLGGTTMIQGQPKVKANWDPNRPIDLTPNGFLLQPSLCLLGRMIARKAVIKYAANVASGVHSGRIETDDEKILARLSASAAVNRIQNGLHFKPIPAEVPKEFRYEPDEIDVVQYDLLCSATYLVNAPDVDRLVKYIREEFKLPSPSS
ncbi:MAG TPA: hypothetical protein VGO52_17290 [Hyphomonadaceae bacterium]|nr:hypothetical protein [Hyphomonadaceae bacterium]